MALIASIDPVNRDVYLSADTVGASINPIDIYKEMRTLRKNDETLRPYDVFMSAFGNVSKGGGKFTERYVRLNSGTRIIPYDVSHELTITGTIITDDGQEGVACFDRSPLTATTVVDINYVPPQVEVVRAETELAALRYLGFTGMVVVDEVNGFPGTGLAPNGVQIGYRQAPSNNINDANIIADENSLPEFRLHGAVDMTGFDISGDGHSYAHVFSGDNPRFDSIGLASDTVIPGSQIYNLYIAGPLSADSIVERCVVGSVSNANGFFYESTLIGPIVIGGTTNIENCFINADTPSQECVIDFNNQANTVIVGDWSAGRLVVKNMVAGSFIGVAGTGGAVVNDVSNSGGTIVHGGSIRIDDQGGTLDLLKDSTSAGQVWVNADGLDVLTRMRQAHGRMGLDASTPVTNNPDGSYSFGSVIVSAAQGQDGEIVQSRQ